MIGLTCPTVTEVVALAFVDSYGFEKALEEAARLGETAKQSGMLDGYYLMLEVIDHLVTLQHRSIH